MAAKSPVQPSSTSSAGSAAKPATPQNSPSELDAKPDDGTLSTALAKDGATALPLESDDRIQAEDALHGSGDEHATKFKTSI